ncbi:MAG: hypothetical protein KF861_13115, partial [Planctomycetaceae bacterium]|nr:hypothetical protein [Planctomycetaceae bacterium]
MIRVALLGLVAATWTLLWGTSVPLGVSGEWIWPRLPVVVETFIGGLVALIGGTAYVAFVLWGQQRIDAVSHRAALGQVAALVAAAFVWLWTVQQSVPPPADLGKAPFVLFYPRSSGYFWQARYEVNSTAQFLAGYEDLLAQRDYLHIGTHPPGLTLGFRGLMHVCGACPALCDLVMTTCPAS